MALTNCNPINKANDGEWPAIYGHIGQKRVQDGDWGGNYALVKFSCTANHLGQSPTNLPKWDTGVKGRYGYYLIQRSDGEIGSGDNYSHHSEQLLALQIQAMTGSSDVVKLVIDYVFTEREPCSGLYGYSCSSALATILRRFGALGEGTPVTYLAVYPNSTVPNWKLWRQQAAATIKAEYS